MQLHHKYARNDTMAIIQLFSVKAIALKMNQMKH